MHTKSPWLVRICKTTAQDLRVGSLFSSSMKEVFTINTHYHCNLYFYPAFINNVTDCFRYNYHHHHTLSSRNDILDYRSSTVLSGAPNDNFRKIICSEDDLRSRIFGTFSVKFLACLPLLGFSNIKKWYNCPFLTDFYPKKVT